jgi:L-ascorbate metabolism protein UlaG (beta-lactamase superfamily)
MRITWFGHSAFRVEFGEARILIDPFLTGNPTFERQAGGDVRRAVEEASRGCTHVLLTHGHNDHLGDALDICRSTGAQLVGSAEVCDWLEEQGVENVNLGNHGGTVNCGGFTTSFVNAQHSSSWMSKKGEIVYLGNPLGLVVKAEGQPTLYHMGDTDIFGDMALIAEIHRPEIGIVPIGDRFTMGARTAAMACRRFFDFRRIFPCHYATFPLLDPTADKFLAEMGEDAQKVAVPRAGEAVEV